MPHTFINISQVDQPNGVGDPTVVLTLDLDWAHDVVIGESIDIIERAEVAATWFVTHRSPILDRLRANPAFELGIHPNFNLLLDGDKRNGTTAAEVVDRLLEFVPEATSVRSHSLFQSERLADLFASRGLRTISNFYVPHEGGRATPPWRLWSDLLAVPHCWQDNVSMRVHGLIEPPSLIRGAINVVDFHPIHVFLNTERVERYENSRPDHGYPERLRGVRYVGRGARMILHELLEAAS